MSTPTPEFEALLAGLAAIERAEREAEQALIEGLRRIDAHLDALVEALRAA